MDPTEFDEFDALLREQKWDSAFQVGWRVLHRLMRSFYANVTLCDRKGKDDERRARAQEIDRAGDRHLFSTWPGKLDLIDIQGAMGRETPSLWQEYLKATQLRHFVFHGRVYLERGFDVRASAEALRRMMAFVDGVFKSDPRYVHVRNGGPLPPMADIVFDPMTGSVTVNSDPRFDEPDIR